VVLDGNPLSDIHNVARVNLVVKGGVLYQAGANPAR
jgi:hypothetical protein